MKRIPVPNDNYKIFHFWLIEQSKIYGVLEDSDVKRGIEITLDAIESHFGKVKCKSKQNQDVKEFYVIYCKKFLNAFDMETVEQLNGKEVKIIQSLLQNLSKNDISFIEYLDWFFDEFLQNNHKLSPGICLAASNTVCNQYMISNAKRIKTNNEKKRKEIITDQITAKIRTLLRKHNSEELKKLLHEFKEGSISIDSLNLRLIAYENRIEKISKDNIT